MSEPNSPTTSITPHLVCADALKAIEFYKQAFNAVEEMKLLGPTGKLVHAALSIGGAYFMLAEEMPDWGSLGPIALKGSPVVIHLKVPDVDAIIAQAIAAGATLTMPSRHVLGRSIRPSDRPLRSSLVDRDSQAKADSRRDASRDGESIRRRRSLLKIPRGVRHFGNSELGRDRLGLQSQFDLAQFRISEVPDPPPDAASFNPPRTNHDSAKDQDVSVVRQRR